MAIPRNRHHCLSTLTAFTFLLFFCDSALAPRPVGIGVQEVEERQTRSGGLWDWDRVLTQKRLGGPGSSPPTCRSKCGRCSPCRPVHVPIQPGLSIPLEYYPEAWRCKCGNKLFMP
ncbi:EPIDERMAL PATTERNING FACTOR-like protein 5 [Turnera subulata]|uniref:Epidermal patterning factor-like protein n=1 Tax=Turnera subulata TaxID=218843 RepID=A0A9Q0F9U2_9ROSI|nr:EPIDERMAL PATTERNING FACTOR-like protein 5 [Turnera subulata]